MPPTERSTEEARQASQDRKRTLVILIVSTGIAVILAAAAYFYVFAESNEELGAPVPQIDTTEEVPTPN